MPRSRSRARPATPAAQAARAAGEPVRSDGRGRGLSTSMKIGQAIVFVVALGLLALNTVADQLARDEDVHVRIDWLSVALLGVAAFVVVLPRITRVRAAADAVDTDLASRAHNAALTAATVALGRGVGERDPRALLAGEPSPALTRAAADPLTSIELSRRALAAELRRLAAVADVPAPPQSLVGYADRLYGVHWLSGPEAGAIGELAAVIDAAKVAGAVGPGVAQDVDDAVQLLVPLLDGRVDQAAARFERHPAAPAGEDRRAVVDVELDAVDHLDELDELETTDGELDAEAAGTSDAAAAPDDAADGAAGEAADDDVHGRAADVEIDLRHGGADDAVAPNGDAPPAEVATGAPRALEPAPPEPVAWRSPG